MKINNLASGSLAVGMAFAASIAVAPVEALTLAPGSDIAWNAIGDNFLEELGGPLDISLNAGQIQFATGDFATLGLTAGDPVSSPNPNPINFGSPTQGSGTVADPYIYLLSQETRFTFDVDGDDDLFFVIPTNTRFEGLSNGSGEVELCDSCFGRPYWEYQGDQTPAASTIQFSVSGVTAQSVNQNTSETVPEPITIFGSLAALGFGTVLKGQQKKKNG